jgi:RES domain-containing protein
MRVWRLARAPFAVLDGEGARLAGGRWNSIGVPVVYTSAHLSLAILETLVHAVDPSLLPDDLISLEIEIDASLIAPRVDPATLAADWFTSMSSPECIRIGNDWARSGAHLALPVPSAIVPSETNVLLNPRHAAMGSAVTVAQRRTFSIDPRLLRR